MKYTLNTPVIPLVSFLLYYTQGFIIPYSSGASQLLFLIYLLYGCFCMYKVHTKRIDKLTSAIDIFLIIQVLWSVFTPYKVISMEPNDITYIANIKMVLSSLFSYYISIYYVRKGLLNTRLFTIFFIIYIFLTIPKFIYNEIQTLESYWLRGSTRENITNNIGYLFLTSFCILPLLTKRKILTFAILITDIIFILYSSKRGAILILGVLLLMYLPRILKDSKKTRFLVLVAIIALSYVVVDYINTNAYLIERFIELKDGNSSGRDSLFEDIWKYCTGPNASFSSLLFGNGINSTIIIAGNLAHNDWLELFCCCGLIGVFAYANLFINIIRSHKVLLDSPFKESEKYAIVIFFIKSLFSQAYTTATIIFLVIGFTQAILKYNKDDQKFL